LIPDPGGATLHHREGVAMRNLLLAGVLLLPAAALAQPPDVLVGAQLAQTWCAGCHQVTTSGPVKDAVPGFLEIARRPETTEAGLRAFLRMPHGQMPNFELSDANIRPLIAYILSLR
jgi:mono/diheme cytochrome c family protein